MCACSECAKNCGFTGSRLSQWLNLRQPISNDKLAKLKAWIANRAPPQMQSMLPAILSAGHGAGILAQYQFEPLPVRPPPVDRVSVEWHRAWQDRVLRIRQQHDSARAGPLGSGMASLGSMMSPMTDMMGFSVAGVFIGNIWMPRDLSEDAFVARVGASLYAKPLYEFYKQLSQLAGIAESAALAAAAAESGGVVIQQPAGVEAAAGAGGPDPAAAAAAAAAAYTGYGVGADVGAAGMTAAAASGAEDAAMVDASAAAASAAPAVPDAAAANGVPPIGAFPPAAAGEGGVPPIGAFPPEPFIREPPLLGVGLGAAAAPLAPLPYADGPAALAAGGAPDADMAAASGGAGGGGGGDDDQSASEAPESDAEMAGAGGGDDGGVSGLAPAYLHPPPGLAVSGVASMLQQQQMHMQLPDDHEEDDASGDDDDDDDDSDGGGGEQGSDSEGDSYHDSNAGGEASDSDFGAPSKRRAGGGGGAGGPRVIARIPYAATVGRLSSAVTGAQFVPYTTSLEYKNGHVLRRYQLDGVNFMLRNIYEGRNSILADEMGLGKTAQVCVCVCVCVWMCVCVCV